MEYVPGIHPVDLCDWNYPATWRSRWKRSGEAEDEPSGFGGSTYAVQSLVAAGNQLQTRRFCRPPQGRSNLPPLISRNFSEWRGPRHTSLSRTGCELRHPWALRRRSSVGKKEITFPSDWPGIFQPLLRGPCKGCAQSNNGRGQSPVRIRTTCDPRSQL